MMLSLHTYGLKGHQHIAQGNALGSRRWDNRPTGAKALKENNAFAPSGRGQRLYPTQGVALGYVLNAPSGQAKKTIKKFTNINKSLT